MYTVILLIITWVAKDHRQRCSSLQATNHGWTGWRFPDQDEW